MQTTIEVLQEKESRKRKGQIKKVEVRNPLGKPKGTKNAHTLLKEAILQNAEEKVLQEFMTIVDTTVKLANQGDSTCLKILWDRIIPSKREVADKDDKLNVVINISGMETKGVKDVEIIDGELVDEDSRV